MSGRDPDGPVRRHHRPTHRRVLQLVVRARDQLSPHFVSVTLGGDDVQHLEPAGYDQWGRFFIPGPGQEAVQLPQGARWMLQNARSAPSLRPRVRSYTVRRIDPVERTLDVEVAIHQEAGDHRVGPGSSWAMGARPGQVVGFLDEGRRYAPPDDARWQLLVGDESALPAVLAILERAGSLPAEVFVEVPTEDDVRPAITVPRGSAMHWLPRDRDRAGIRPGTLALRAVEAAALPDGPCYVWTAGESALTAGVRRHLVNDRGVPKSRIDFSGYWRLGRASLG